MFNHLHNYSCRHKFLSITLVNVDLFATWKVKLEMFEEIKPYSKRDREYFAMHSVMPNPMRVKNQSKMASNHLVCYLVCIYFSLICEVSLQYIHSVGVEIGILRDLSIEKQNPKVVNSYASSLHYGLDIYLGDANHIVGYFAKLL